MEPVVMDGLRGPRSAREDYARANPGATYIPPIGQGTTYYCEKYSRYRVQITSPQEITDPYTGRTTRDKPIAAQFENHFFVNDKSTKKDQKYTDADGKLIMVSVRDLIDEALQANPQFARPSEGKMGDFCLWAEVQAVDKQKKMEAAIRDMEANPEILEEALKRRASKITQGEEQDFKLPKKEKK